MNVFRFSARETIRRLRSSSSVFDTYARTGGQRKMWNVYLLIYLGLGLVAAGFTLAVFPPHADYRPPIGLLVAAVVAYIVLWPFLAMIGIGYLIGAACRAMQSSRDNFPPRTLRRHKGFVYRALYEETPN